MHSRSPPRRQCASACPIIAIGAEISSSFRGRPNRKWPTHARWSLRRRWRRVDAGSVPRVGLAFGPGAGGRGLAGLQAVKRAAAPTGIIHALDAKRILRYAGLGRSRNVIDRPESCCSEQRGEGYTDHFRTFMARGVLFSGVLGIDWTGTSTSQPDPAHATYRFWTETIRSSIVRYANSASCRRICNGLRNAALSATKQTARLASDKLETSCVRLEAVPN